MPSLSTLHKRPVGWQRNIGKKGGFDSAQPHHPKKEGTIHSSPANLFLKWDAAFLLTIGSFLLTVELFYLQLCFLAFFFLLIFLLTIGSLSLTVGALLLTVGKCL